MEIERLATSRTRIDERVFATVLAIDVAFIVLHGRSPAFFATSDLLTELGSDFFYIAILAYLSAPWISAVLLPIHQSLSWSLYYFGRRLMKMCRLASAQQQFQSRRKLDAGAVEEFAYLESDQVALRESKHNRETLLVAIKRERLQFLSFCLMVTLFLVSSEAHPNFFMKINFLLTGELVGRVYYIGALFFIATSLVARAGFALTLSQARFIEDEGQFTPDQRKAIRRIHRRRVFRAFHSRFDEARFKYLGRGHINRH